MHVDPMFGPAAPERGWVPAPRYLMRRSRILDLSADLREGTLLLEVGCAAGLLLQEFARRGLRCSAVESSVEALALARALAREAALAIDFRDRAAADWHDHFDAVFAFEVLEHAADDRAALAEWAGWLRPGGLLLLSVPAHGRLWTAADEWAGHYRRYERDGLARLLDEQGFAVDRLECYGFPLTNLSERLGGWYHAWRSRRGARDAVAARQAGTARSGVERGAHVRLYPLLGSAPGRLALRGCLALQRRFLTTDLGTGFLVRARRR